MTISKNWKIITDSLIAPKGFDYQIASIVFAGDIDDCGFVNLIIETSRLCNAQCSSTILFKA